MRKIYFSMLLCMGALGLKAQFDSIQPISAGLPSNNTCSFGFPPKDNVNTRAILNRIGHLESGTYGDEYGQWAAIGIPNVTDVVPNSCTMYGFTSHWESDRFFCGLRNDGADRKNALIGWGDNPGGSSLGPDRLIFSFFNNDLTPPDNTNGTEIATMYPNGNMGIGAFFQNATPPHRSLDISNANPQLRLTQTQNANPNLGVYTDFQTTALGDLAIIPRSGILPRWVGVGTTTPISTLHVAGYGTFMGISRDFRLTNAGAVQNNSILSIDQSGTGGFAGLLIRGGNASVNHPNMGFTLLNTSNNMILSSSITGVPVINTPGVETGDLAFSVKPAAGQIVERVRISGTTGFTGFNTNAPTQQIDVNGTARLRNIPTATPNVLLTGVGSGADYVVNRLAFTGNANQVLLGNGTFGAVPGVIAANNGLSVTSGTVQLGQTACTPNSGGQLTRNSFIPMNNFNLVFSDAGASQTFNLNRVGFGVCTPAAKVDILRPQISGSNEAGPLALKVVNTDISSPGTMLGSSASVYALCDGTNRTNSGGAFNAVNASTNIGVSGTGNSYNATYPAANYGGQFGAGQNVSNVGASGLAITSYAQVQTNIGLSGLAVNGITNNYGIYGSTPLTSTGADYAGYFNGDLWYTGSLYAPSDERYKTNIKPVGSMLEKIQQLDVKSYDFINEKGISFPTVNQVGIMAQNLEKVFPTLVKKSYLTSFEATSDPSLNKEIKAVNYAGLIPVLVEAVKELDAKVAEPNKALEAELADLKTKYNQLNDLINDLCNNGCDIFKTPTTGSIKPASLLFQNIPNPFTKLTVINYSIAEGAQKAEMLLSDMNGQPLQKINLELSTQGTVSIPSDNLSVGTFTYSLIVDGKLIDTKKMMLTGN